MLDTAFQIHYDAFEDCERVVIDYLGLRTSIGFETDEELCIYLAAHGFPEYVNTEVCAEVRRHRMADQMEFEDSPARCRSMEPFPRRCTDTEWTPPAGGYYVDEAWKTLSGLLLVTVAVLVAVGFWVTWCVWRKP